MYGFIWVVAELCCANQLSDFPATTVVRSHTAVASFNYWQILDILLSQHLVIVFLAFSYDKHYIA
jgi:hypothetical protein